MTDLIRAACSREEAEEITGRFRDAVTRVESAWGVVVSVAIDAFNQRVWLPLGYKTWDEYCTAEVDTAAARIPRELRVEIVGQMSEAGMSTRAIGSALGVDHKTVINDRQSGGEFSPPDNNVIGIHPPVEQIVNKITGEVVAEIEWTHDELAEKIAAELAASDGQFAEQAKAAAPIVGTDGKTYAPQPKRAAYRKPLPDVAKAAGFELRKAMERVEKLFDDNRYRQNEEQVAQMLRGHLLYVADTVAAVLDQLQ